MIKLRYPGLYYWLRQIMVVLQRVNLLIGSATATIFDFLPMLPWLFIKRSKKPHSGDKLVVMLVISEVWHDLRIEREARHLAAAGFKVKIMYPDWFSETRNIPPLDWGPGIEFRPLPGDYWRYVRHFPYLFQRKWFSAACQEEAFCFHAHDLSTALIALAAANRAGSRCVCDFHEWYSENVTLDPITDKYRPHSRLKRSIYRLAEKWLLRHADEAITVCDSIAVEMRESLSPTGRPIQVIRNIPSYTETAGREPHERSIAAIRRLPGNNDSAFWLLYQGGTGPVRMLEPIIAALPHVPSAIFVIRGPGIEVFGRDYENLAASLGVADRVLCLPAVPAAAVVSAAIGADAGIWTLPNLCKNFCYALPNKLFEYLASGLPVLAADYPEVKKVVDGYKVGLCFDPYDPKSIAEKIQFMIDNQAFRQQCATNTKVANAGMRAEDEWSKLVAIYRELWERGAA